MTDGQGWLPRGPMHPASVLVRQSARAAMEELMPMIMDVDTKAHNHDGDEQRGMVDFLGGVVTSMNDRIAALENRRCTGVQQPNAVPAHGSKRQPTVKRKATP